MDYEKMKALMEARGEKSELQRDQEVKQFPRLDSPPEWKYLDYVGRERVAA